MLPRAEYEDQVAEWTYNVTINLMEQRDRNQQNKEMILKIYNFLEKFCHFSSLELHDQLMLELPDFPRLLHNLV